MNADRQLGAASGLFLATSRGLWRRTRENQRTPPLHRVGAATRRQRTHEATQRQTSSEGRASGPSPALHDLLRVSTELAGHAHTGSDPANPSTPGIRSITLGKIHSSPHNCADSSVEGDGDAPAAVGHPSLPVMTTATDGTRWPLRPPRRSLGRPWAQPAGLPPAADPARPTVRKRGFLRQAHLTRRGSTG